MANSTRAVYRSAFGMSRGLGAEWWHQRAEWLKSKEFSFCLIGTTAVRFNSSTTQPSDTFSSATSESPNHERRRVIGSRIGRNGVTCFGGAASRPRLWIVVLLE
ncbi:MAG: hypothetical protein CMO80_09730 [Verrucomicrobiales bacterium]|nr:hypothetical protein [Verrucomicrobiales bacterium]